MKLHNNQNCAAFVFYPPQNEYCWILTKVEKKQTNGKYLLRDDYADDQQYEHYIVDSTRISPFPAADLHYDIGEHVLSLWFDAESREWSTMLYEAVVKEKKGSNVLCLEFQGSPSSIIEVEVDKVTKFPPGFDVTENVPQEKIEPPTEEQLQGVPPQEMRRVNMVYQQPRESQRQNVPQLNDDDFTRLGGERPPINRMSTQFGTPLLDHLADRDLFPAENPHITGNGRVCAKNLPASKVPSAVEHSRVPCGRLGIIVNRWSFQ